MKRKLCKFIIVCALICLAMALVACGKDEPPHDHTTHTWNAGEVTKAPVCGGEDGVRTYTCTECNETRTEAIPAAEKHDFDRSQLVKLKEPTCTEDGQNGYPCKNCGEYYIIAVSSKGGHKYGEGVLTDDSYTVTCTVCGLGYTYAVPLTYSQFGAVGDGVTDDFAAIAKTHEVANELGLPVEADDGAVYYIGQIDGPAFIRTDTSWGNAKFIIDDTAFPYAGDGRIYPIFRVAPDVAAKTISVPKGLTLTAGQTKIDGLKLDGPCMLNIRNNKDKDYIRYGANATEGADKQEVILVDEYGNVDPRTPIQYDYSAVTSIMVLSSTETPITISGGHFETIANQPENQDQIVGKLEYYYRNIVISRSNVTVDGVKHTIVEGPKDMKRGAPYCGFFRITDCANVTLVDCELQGHQAYKFQDGNYINEMGSYDLFGVKVIGLKLDHLVQTNSIVDRDNQHGLIGTDYCRNVELTDCWVDRFDAHTGLYNVTVRNSTLGFNFFVIGGGTVLAENVTRLTGNYFIGLRDDYGSVFAGDIILKNCTFKSTGTLSVVDGYWRSFDYGLPGYYPQNVELDNFRSDNPCVIFSVRTNTSLAGALTDKVNPFLPTKTLVMKNMEYLPLTRTSAEEALFVDTVITMENVRNIPPKDVVFFTNFESTSGNGTIGMASGATDGSRAFWGEFVKEGEGGSNTFYRINRGAGTADSYLNIHQSSISALHTKDGHFNSDVFVLDMMLRAGADGAAATNFYLVSEKPSKAYDQFLTVSNGGVVSLGSLLSAADKTVCTLSKTDWTRVTVELDFSANTVKAYVNGTLVVSGTVDTAKCHSANGYTYVHLNPNASAPAGSALELDDYGLFYAVPESLGIR